MTAPIRIDVWSDVACPWCYIGKRRLERGLDAFAADAEAPPVELVFHSFELSPDTPVEFEGTSLDYLSQHKGIPAEQVRQMHAQITAIAAEVGLDYDLAGQRPTNTRKAHQLLHLALAHGLQEELKERLLRAHFVEGGHLGRDDDLADLAAEVGLDRTEVLETLRSDRYLDAVDADIADARELGISGVPFFVLDRRYAISGAQPDAVFTQALERVMADRAATADAPAEAPSPPRTA